MSPDTEKLVVPGALDGAADGHGIAIRVTVKVTPRGNPQETLENTVTLSLSERGRVAVWDKQRVE